jgi:thiol-disulfide isomerase/thioredoxin
MPSLGGATEWLNSEPLGPAELRGHVVLVDFWTLTCINWLRQEPYIRAWSQAYRNDGLVVIGVHTPEFSFEHDIDGVRQATKERGIDYPVAVDNDYEIWSAFDNHYWPALYFVDADGIIRDHHFGEGRYEQSERVIQRLLGVERELVSVAGLGVEAEADWDHLRTPETYLGYGRSEHFAPRDGVAFDEHRAYELPERLRFNHWALAGEWTIGRESVVLDRAGGSIAYRFHARDAHLVLAPGARQPIPFRVLLNGEAPGPSTAWTSTRLATACSGTAACTTSCASTTRSANGRWRSRSSNPAPRHTSSRSGNQRPRRSSSTAHPQRRPERGGVRARCGSFRGDGISPTAREPSLGSHRRAVARRRPVVNASDGLPAGTAPLVAAIEPSVGGDALAIERRGPSF